MTPLSKAIAGGALVASTLLGGALGAIAVSNVAGAQSATSSTDTTQAQSSQPSQPPPRNGQAPDRAPNGQAPDPSKGGHVANGVTEQLLTGETADKVKAAAEAAVSDATVERVENDAEGAAYEAHMAKADGSQVTVKLDSTFTVTSVEDGMR